MERRFRERVYDNKPQSLCYGCKACEQVCPCKAIEMRDDSEGFRYPKINTDLCVDCGMCQKSCPTQDLNIEKFLHKTPERVDAAWNKNLDERLKSTSGGLFYLLAERWIREGGVVFGAGYDGHLKVEHRSVETIEDLKALRGSKYVQSDVGNTFALAKEFLKQGRKVLYSGTPCQIAGLKSFLGKDPDNLQTIDLVCHGTPSPKFLPTICNGAASSWEAR